MPPQDKHLTLTFLYPPYYLKADGRKFFKEYSCEHKQFKVIDPHKSQLFNICEEEI